MKHATCKWCNWRSATTYEAGDLDANERAFEEQGNHVALYHPEKFDEIQELLDDLGAEIIY